MTDAQVVKLLAVLSAAFDREVLPETVEVYKAFLRDIDFHDGDAAVRELIACGGVHFPRISEIRKIVGERRTQLPTAEEAWAAVADAVCRYGRNNPPPWPNAALEAAVRAIGWVTICNTTTVGVERSHFMRAYQSYRDRAVMDATLMGLKPPAELSAIGKQAIAQGAAALEEAKASAPVPVGERVAVALERLKS